MTFAFSFGDLAPARYPIALAGFDDDFTIPPADPGPEDGFRAAQALSWSEGGSSCRIDYIGADGLTHRLDVEMPAPRDRACTGDVSCFALGTMIETADGPRPVESLRPGDRLCCSDGQSRPILWVGQRHVDAAELARRPQCRPIRIRRGALAAGLPRTDLLVAPRHRILLRDWRAELLFGAAEVLVPAVHLVNDRDIVHDPGARGVTYFQFLFESHQTVFCNGIESESFHPGGGAIEGLEDAPRQKLLALFPELEADPDLYGETCCPSLKAHEALAMLGL